MPMQMKDFDDNDIRATINQILSVVDVNACFDIPYLAGYSEDGHTIYIDRHVPLVADIKDKRVKIFPKLVMHEVVEKVLNDFFHLKYFMGHQLALRCEAALVEADGIKWNDYEEFLQPYIKRADKEQLLLVPSDLDLKPYEDYGDIEKLKALLNAGVDKQG